MRLRGPLRRVPAFLLCLGIERRRSGEDRVCTDGLRNAVCDAERLSVILRFQRIGSATPGSGSASHPRRVRSSWYTSEPEAAGTFLAWLNDRSDPGAARALRREVPAPVLFLILRFGGRQGQPSHRIGLGLSPG